ncbi:dephospho-CoA kinase [Gottschalkia purinilytica]|uniref:Dephospho-CoA kinase n=1 Tax=Gottschalkia purinilytica TaxID=1503 RepID=A0A0L0WDG2_GOTPU|nr:dephospho-CoA kinase [Gottschalkia purinilytica]KNF09476.1 dephospho-CoA kinase [Gottschalkia purinilytica]
MIQSKIIGITGGIATGKSTVSNMIKDKGFVVIDADQIARDIVKIGTPAYKEIVLVFREKILNSQKEIDRSRLGHIIFNDDNARNTLNKITHPHIINEIKSLIELYSKTNDVIFLDIPLLIEIRDSILENGIKIDEIWIVYADEDTQLKRLMKRDKLDYNSAVKKMKAQMHIDEKVKYADVIINNNEGIDYLYNNLLKALDRI